MSKSIAKNLMYNLLLQVVTLVLPLITVPYVSRVLGANGIGTYSYTLSITQYFILIGTLGLSMYGNRQIAYTRDDKENMSRTFWSILFLRMITTGVATVVYIILFYNVQSYKEVFFIQTLNIIAAMIDISWLYMGLEDFKKIVTRNIAVRIIGVSLIFAFVKSSQDLNLYVLINVLMILLGNAVMWFYLPSTVSKIKINLKELFKHIIPSMKLFVPQIAIQIYVVLDKTMIGILANVTEVGYYDQSEKIVKVVLGLVTALGTVMLPRMSNLHANGNKEEMNNYLNSSLKGVSYFAIPLSLGLVGISNNFVPWFYGEGYESIKYIIPMISPILFFISMSNVMGTQYLLPSNRTREFTISVTFGAIINFILNLIFIPRLKAFGACVGTVIAEFTVTVIQYICLKKEIDIKGYLKGVIKYLISGVIMLIIVLLIGISMSDTITTTIIQIIFGAISYIVILTIMKEDINKSLFLMVIGMINKRR